MSVNIQTSQNVSLEYEIASIGDRILAQLIDYLVYIGWAFVWVLIMRNSGGNSTFVFMLAVYLVILLYPLLTEYFLEGQTLGKRALDIKVVRLDGGKPTLGAYILRWLLIIIDVSLFGGLVAVITIAISQNGQRLGDIAAGTTVIKTKKRVTIDDVLYQKLPDNYKVTYSESSQLQDSDIETLRVVLRKQNDELLYITADKIKDILSIDSATDPRHFLQTIINDYTFLAYQTAEE